MLRGGRPSGGSWLVGRGDALFHCLLLKMLVGCCEKEQRRGAVRYDR